MVVIKIQEIMFRNTTDSLADIRSVLRDSDVILEACHTERKCFAKLRVKTWGLRSWNIHSKDKIGI